MTLFEVNDLIEITPPDDFQKFENYKEVNSKESPLKEIIATYTSKDKIQCGLTDCHTKHNFGYLVETKDGYVTNIGKDCGKSHFGADFKNLNHEFRHRSKLDGYKRRLNLVLSEYDQLMAKIHDMLTMPYGANWQSVSLAEFKKRYPKSVLMILREKGLRNDGRIYKNRPLSQEEIDIRKAANPDPNAYIERFEREYVGTLKGVSIFQYHKPTAYGILTELHDNLVALANLDKVSIAYNPKELYNWYDWANRISFRLHEAEQLIAAGREFFKQDNLDMLQHEGLDRDAKNFLRNKVWHYEEAHTRSRKKAAA